MDHINCDQTTQQHRSLVDLLWKKCRSTTSAENSESKLINSNDAIHEFCELFSLVEEIRAIEKGKLIKCTIIRH